MREAREEEELERAFLVRALRDEHSYASQRGEMEQQLQHALSDTSLLRVELSALAELTANAHADVSIALIDSISPRAALPVGF